MLNNQPNIDLLANRHKHSHKGGHFKCGDCGGRGLKPFLINLDISV